MAPLVFARDRELAALKRLFSDRERGAALAIIEGEAGIGKTVLLDAAVAEARALSYRVLVARPAQSEASLSFATLGDLFRDSIDEVLPSLPGPQARALASALVIAEWERGTGRREAVALAVLGTMRALAVRGPLLLAIDDLQWVDVPSARALEFAFRRLDAEPVRILLARRTVEHRSAAIDLQRIELPLAHIEPGPLPAEAVDRLLRARLDVVLPRPTLARLHRTSGGNPFFALELARELLRRTEPHGPRARLAVPGNLRALVGARLGRLEKRTRDALLAAAALSAPTLDLVRAACGDGSWVDDAVSAGVIQLADDGRIRFAHPLLASVVYAEAGLEQQRSLHRRLAEIVTDPEEQARHLAVAATGSDAAIAEALGTGAVSAARRGAPESAAELMEQASLLTPPTDAEARGERILRAAEYHFEAGDTDRTEVLLDELIAAAPSGLLRARALDRLGRLRMFAADIVAAVRLFQEALDTASSTRLRSESEQGLAWTLYIGGEDYVQARRHAAAAASLAAEAGDDAALGRGLAIEALTAAIVGDREAPSLAERALSLTELEDEERVLRDPRFAYGLMLLFQDDLAGAEREFAGLHQRGRERGDQSAVASLALSRGLVALYAGEWAAAEQLAGESHDAAIQTRQGHAAASALGLLSYLHANRGDVERARIEATEAERLSEPMPRGVYFSQVLPMWALATLSLLDGDASSAAERLAPLHARAAAAGLADPGRLDFVPDLVEALVSLGRADEAEALLDDYERRAQEFGRTWAILGAARCRAMLALTRGDPPAAVSVLEPVVDKLPVLGRRFERGRALLVLGPARRHAMQKRGARDALDQALVIFDELGARGWADRTRAERGRISGRAPASGGLTPAEQRVAALVAEGRTNREVAAALFVTEHTVESHLRNVFRKMRVRSRAQLARRFAEPERDPAS